MARKLRFTLSFRVNGTLTNLTSAVMADSAATYGVKRLDTGLVIVTDHNPAAIPPELRPMVNDATGRYSFEINDDDYALVSSKTYRGAMKLVTPEGDTIYRTQDVVYAPSATIVDYDKFVRKWGRKAIIEVSNKDHATGADIDDDLVQDAFLWAEAKVNMLLHNGRYAVPLVFADAVDPVAEEWVMVLAYARLYYDRFDDSSDIEEIDLQIGNQTGKKVHNSVTRVLNEIALVNSGFGGLTGATTNTSFDLTPSLLTPQDVEDAWDELSLTVTRNGVWTR